MIRENLANLLTQEEYNRELAQLTQAVLHLIDNLSEDDLSEVRHLREEMHERILVVTRPARRAYMERFFSKNYFKNVYYIHYGDSIPSERFDLAVLEDIEPEPASTLHIGDYVNGMTCYFLYFGERFPLDRSKYADKVYFANSIFSLYARIKEMLDFMKYYDEN